MSTGSSFAEEEREGQVILEMTWPVREEAAFRRVSVPAEYSTIAQGIVLAPTGL